MNDKWLNAQKHEIKHHVAKFNPKLDDPNSQFYYGLYYYYFKLLNLDFDIKNQSVLEIGPAKISALCFCSNYNKSYIIEPLIFEDTLEYYASKNITIIHTPAEECEIPKVNQAWLFNVLQHVIDPIVIIEKLKKCVDVIFFFEPINYPTNNEHIHMFDENFFISMFDRESVSIYTGNSLPNFHSANCAYGKYIVNKTE